MSSPENWARIIAPETCYDCGGLIVKKSEHGIGWFECESCGRVYATKRPDEKTA